MLPNYVVQVAKSNMENMLHNLDNEIQLNKRFCEDKQAFYAIIKVQKSLDKLDELLLDKNDCDIIVLTRAVAEYNQLMFNMIKCNNILKTVHLKVWLYTHNLKRIISLIIYLLQKHYLIKKKTIF